MSCGSWARRGDRELGTVIEPAAGVVERVDAGAGLKMQVAGKVDPLQHMLEEPFHIAYNRRRGGLALAVGEIFGGCNQQVLAETCLVESQNGVRRFKQFERLAFFGFYVGQESLMSQGET